jgi:hypothetical protein
MQQHPPTVPAKNPSQTPAQPSAPTAPLPIDPRLLDQVGGGGGGGSGAPRGGW